MARPLKVFLRALARARIIRFVLIDCFLEVVVLRAFSKEGTSLFQYLELLLGVGRLIHLEVKLAKIFECAPMIGIDLQRYPVLLHRFVEGAEFAIAVAEHGVCIDIFWVPLNSFH